MARRLGVRADVVWEVLVDTAAWPSWGPSVRAVELEGGGTRIGPGAVGQVRTAVGIRLPFVVTEWEDGHRWAWRVAGVPATGHGVRADPDDPSASRAQIDIPVWAPAYAPLCWVALGRIGRVAADR